MGNKLVYTERTNDYKADRRCSQLIKLAVDREALALMTILKL